MLNNSFENIPNQEEVGFNIKKEISYYLFFWPWFLLTVIMAFVASFLYLRYTPNVYMSSAQVQITKSDASSSFLTTEITSLFGNRVNVENDISVITSPHILNKVVQRLNLQTSVTQIGRIRSSLKFKQEIPFEIKFFNKELYQKWKLVFSEDSIFINNGFKVISTNLDEIYEEFKFNIPKDEILFIKEWSNYIYLKI